MEIDLEKLSVAVQYAGAEIQRYFKKCGYGFPEFRWIQTELQQPAFQHLCFGFKNRIYSVLVAIVMADGRIMMDEQTVDNQLRECEKNNLISGVIPMREYLHYYNPMTRMEEFPLVNTAWFLARCSPIRLVSPRFYDLEEEIEMSPWEVHSLAIQVVRDDIIKHGGRVLSYCDIIGIHPSIWFEQEKGKAFVFVQSLSGGTPVGEEIRLSPDIREKLKGYGCYRARVSVASAEPGKPLLRSKPCFIDYKGLESASPDDFPSATESYILREDV